MFVRLSGPEAGPGAAGHWTDAASAEYGDLLDVIRESCGFIAFRDVADEARRFLRVPRAEPDPPTARTPRAPAPTGSPEAARRLFAMSQPIGRTLVETYLRDRGITHLHGTGALRFHPRCYYRPDDEASTQTWPAMIASVTDLSGDLTGVQRTWLDPSGCGKAPIDTPRRAMGHLLGHAVRLGQTTGSDCDAMAAGEGIETMLSLRCILTTLPMTAALSSAHLAALQLPPALRRLYIARDLDSAGHSATERLADRAREAGIEALVLSSQCGDFNDDLRRLGIDRLRADLRAQLAPGDFSRFALDE